MFSVAALQHSHQGGDRGIRQVVGRQHSRLELLAVVLVLMEAVVVLMKRVVAAVLILQVQDLIYPKCR